MAIDKAVDSAQLNADLTAVADAIRTKGGTSDALAFPDGFVEAVGAIQAGGGDNETLIALVNGTLTDFVAPEGAGEIRAKLFSGATALKTADLRNVTVAIGSEAFDGCSSLETVLISDTLNGTVIIKGRAFRNCTKLQNVRTRATGQATSATPGIFMGCTLLKTIDMPNYLNNSAQMFSGCTALEFVRLQRGVGSSQSFYNCSTLKTLVLTSNTMSNLANTNAFTGTPFESGGTGGTVYVPEALIESYQTATNWSTLYAAGTCTFAAIEGSEYE